MKDRTNTETNVTTLKPKLTLQADAPKSVSVTVAT